MDDKTHKVITKAIEMHFLNLEKADNLPIQKGNTRRAHLINWMKIISTDKKKERYMLAATSPVLELLNEKIEEIVRSPEEQRLFDSRMKLKSDIVGGFEAKFREGMQQGIEKGREEGIEERNIFLARSFRDMGVPLDKIAKATGLSEEKIASL